MTQFRVLSLFAGVGGFDLGLEAAGMVSAFQAEIDPYCQQILRKHWPDVPKWGDVSALTGKQILECTGGIEVVAWGSPCQDLSIAGRRDGLGGARSGLFYQGIRIIKEMLEESNGEYPRWSVWENVAGALSSNYGRDFGTVLREMANAGAHFSEWSVLDAQHFGIPHRRRRVYVISVFDPRTATGCSEPLLPVQQSSPRDSPPVRTSQDAVAPTSTGHNSEFGLSDTSSAPIILDRAAFNQGKNAQYRPHVSENPVFPCLISKGPHAVHVDGVLRVITPLECERIMGWPDNHTLLGADGKIISNTQRYRMCGNGVASPVARWIGEQILDNDYVSLGETGSD